MNSLQPRTYFEQNPQVRVQVFYWSRVNLQYLSQIIYSYLNPLNFGTYSYNYSHKIVY